MDRDELNLSLVLFAIWSGPANVATYLPRALSTSHLLDRLLFTSGLISLILAASTMTDGLYASRKYWYYAIVSLPVLLISWMIVTEL